jgi:hypothetical protein
VLLRTGLAKGQMLQGSSKLLDHPNEKSSPEHFHPDSCPKSLLSCSSFARLLPRVRCNSDGLPTSWLHDLGEDRKPTSAPCGCRGLHRGVARDILLHLPPPNEPDTVTSSALGENTSASHYTSHDHIATDDKRSWRAICCEE